MNGTVRRDRVLLPTLAVRALRLRRRLRPMAVSRALAVHVEVVARLVGLLLVVLSRIALIWILLGA